MNIHPGTIHLVLTSMHWTEATRGFWHYRTGPMQDTANGLPRIIFRNCLENQIESRIGALKDAKRGRRRLDRPLTTGEDPRLRSLQLFSKQFLHARL